MTTQILGSILVGLIVSAALFLPHLVWQYRCYGRFDGLRMLWTTAGFIYATAIVAFTVFPLPEFTADYCAAHSTRPLIDPLRFPRELVDLVRSQGPRAVLSDGLVWEFGLNIVLFIPFGLIVRRVMEWPRSAVFTAALSTSMLIELTQLTGNWGLAPCSYRFADTTVTLSANWRGFSDAQWRPPLPRTRGGGSDALRVRKAIPIRLPGLATLTPVDPPGSIRAVSPSGAVPMPTAPLTLSCQ